VNSVFELVGLSLRPESDSYLRKRLREVSVHNLYISYPRRFISAWGLSDAPEFDRTKQQRWGSIMYNVLVAIDDSPLSKRTVDEALSICSGRKDECLITVLHVRRPSVPPTEQGLLQSPMQTVSLMQSAPLMQSTPLWTPDENVDSNEDTPVVETEETNEVLKQASGWLTEEGVKYITILKSGEPAHEICKYAEEYETNLIVMGRQDKGSIERIFLGSVSKKVVQDAPVSVLVVK